MHLDDAQTKLVRELTEAITGTVSESDRIAKAVYKLRAAGINVELSLDGTINLSTWPDQAVNLEGHPFLRSAHLRVDH
jgi:hypothetical protein